MMTEFEVGFAVYIYEYIIPLLISTDDISAIPGQQK